MLSHIMLHVSHPFLPYNLLKCKVNALKFLCACRVKAELENRINVRLVTMVTSLTNGTIDVRIGEVAL